MVLLVPKALAKQIMCINTRRMGEVMAYETRAAMVPWIFSPVMDLGRDPRWPRHWESWGEDPYLQAEMSVAETIAAQGEDPNHIDLEHVAVSIKHYLAYGTPVSGQDRTPGMVSPCDLREKYFRPFKECFQAGALTLMANSASVNGVPVHSSYEYLTQWCKKDLGWDGMVVTDWADINNLYTREHIAADRLEAVEIGINAGVDMIMDPYDPAVCADIVTLVKQGRISQERLDDAVRRVLRLKARLGLFENPVWSVDGYEKFACGEFAKISYDAAVESMVLLKNDSDLLPLAKGKRILVTGPNANSMRTLNGGWSYTWQGEQTDSFASGYNTILEALINEFGAKNVNYRPGVSYYGSDWKADRIEDLSGVVAAARNADVVIACVGENSYCETPGYPNIYLIDNASTYPPLLAYYQDVIQDGRVRLLTLSRNFGHRALWRARILEYLDIRTPFVYTDPDVLPIEACPSGLVARLYQILRRYPFVDKVGTGIVIDDLPAHVAAYVQTGRQYRQVPLEEAVDFCPCDTTFALYAPGASYSIGMSIGTRGRLQVRHLPWYLDPEHLPDDEAYYVAHADASSTFAKDAKKDD